MKPLLVKPAVRNAAHTHKFAFFLNRVIHPYSRQLSMGVKYRTVGGRPQPTPNVPDGNSSIKASRDSGFTLNCTSCSANGYRNVGKSNLISPAPIRSMAWAPGRRIFLHTQGGFLVVKGSPSRGLMRYPIRSPVNTSLGVT